MDDDPMASEKRIRTIGKRRRSAGATSVTSGQPPTLAAREAMTRMAQYRTRVPKGVFIYRDHEGANRDWEEWRVATMQANSRAPR